MHSVFRVAHLFHLFLSLTVEDKILVFSKETQSRS